jgi:hypothetical protein
MDEGYTRSLRREGEDAAVVDAYRDTFVTNPQDEDVGRIKDQQYSEELAYEEDKYRSFDLESKKLQAAIEKETERKIMSDMERLADFIILRNRDGKYTKAKEELLNREYKREYIKGLEKDSTYGFDSNMSELKSKREDVKDVKDVSPYDASSVYMNRLKGYQQKKEEERNPSPEGIQTRIDKLQKELDALQEQQGNIT